MDINTGQIIDSLQKQLDNHKVDFDVSEVGEVIMVGDGVARVQGLENVLSSEMVEAMAEDNGIIIEEQGEEWVYEG